MSESNSTTTPLIYTIDEAADYLKVSRKTIERLIHSGALGHKKIGRSYRISQHALNEFMTNDEKGVTVTMTRESLRRLRA